MYCLVVSVFLYLSNYSANHDGFVVNAFNQLLQSVYYVATNRVTPAQLLHLVGFLHDNKSMLQLHIERIILHINILGCLVVCAY